MSITDIRDFWVIHRQTIRIVLALLVLVGMVGGTVWLFFFNKGTLTVVAEAPFKVNVPGIVNGECQENECSLEVAVGSYNMVASKDGFEDVEVPVEISQGKEVRKEINFKFIPKISDVGVWQVGENVKKYAQQFQGINLFGGGLNDAEVMKFFEKYNGDDFAWLAKMKKFVFLNDDVEDLKQGLYLTSVDFGDLQRITIFPRRIENAIMAVSPTEDMLGLIDVSANPSQIYVINLADGGKSRVGEVNNALGLRWIGENSLLIEHSEEGEGIVMDVLKTDTGDMKRLPFGVDIKNLASVEQGEILVITGKTLALDSRELPSEFWLQSYDVESGELEKLIDLKKHISFFPEAIEISEDKKILRVLANGRLYDVRLQN